MSNIMFGRSVKFGRWIFAGPVRTSTSITINYPKIDNHFDLDFYDSSGLRTASISNDMKNSPLLSCEFELDEHGCAAFDFTLAKDHGINIGYNQRVDVRLFGSISPWYSGFVQERPVEGTTEDTRTYKGYGFFEQLDNVIVESATYNNTEISAITRDIIQNYIENRTGAHWNSSRVYSTGYTATTLTFDHVSAKDALKQLAEFAVNYVYGVDERRRVFFKARNLSINENSRFVIGYHIDTFKPEEDVTTVVNKVYVKGGSLNNSGSNIMYVCSDADSIAAYGLRAAVLSIPSAYSDSDAARWGENQLSTKKTPQRTAKVDGIHTNVAMRNIRPEGCARITSNDGKCVYDYPIKKVKYKMSGEGIKMTMTLGEYENDVSQVILQMERDAKNAEAISDGNSKQLATS